MRRKKRVERDTLQKSQTEKVNAPQRQTEQPLHSQAVQPQIVQRALENPSPQTLTRDVVLSLQASHGNAFVSRLVQRSQQPAGDSSLVIQRMPTRGDITSVYGAPSTGTKRFSKKQKQANYHTVLNALDQFHEYRDKVTITPETPPKTIETVFEMMDMYYGAIRSAIEVYLTGSKKFRKAAVERKKYMTELQEMVKAERAMAQELRLILIERSIANLNRWNVQRERGGGLNKVYEYADGFFKENHRTLKGPEDVERAKQRLIPFEKRHVENVNKMQKHIKGEEVLPEEEVKKLQEKMKESGEAQSRENEKYYAIENESNIREMAGIDPKKANTANRDVAMSRLDQLLGTDMIVKAQLAIERDGMDIREGVFMEKAKGTQFSSLGGGEVDVVGVEREVWKTGGYVNEPVGKPKEAKGKNAMYINDPNFMRQLSRLQLLDTLAMQIDRNTSNFFVVLDNSGNVVSLSGIDNDMAFGTGVTIDERIQEYPGLSRYVDRELAEKIINLDPGLLRLALMDLLSPEELDAIVKRLELLKVHLKELQSKKLLLEPDQWNEAVAKELLVEKSNYFKSAYDKAIRNKTSKK